MASWITASVAICILAAVCWGFEHKEELHHHFGGEEELFEHHKPELHHEEHKIATSYQNFKLESKDPVPVIIKKKEHHHHEVEHEIEHHPHFEHHHHHGIEGF